MSSITSLIHQLERRDLEGVKRAYPNLDGYLSTQWGFLHVASVMRFWEDGNGEGARGICHHAADLLTGLASQRTPFIFVLTGSQGTVSIYYAFISSILEHCKEILETAFPGLEAKECNPTRLRAVLQRTPHCLEMTGIPANRTDKEGRGVIKPYQLERLPHAFSRAHWAFVVDASPLPPEDIETHISDLSEGLRRIKIEYLHPGELVKDVDPLMTYLDDLAQKSIDRFKRGRLEGMWAARTYFLAEDRVQLAKAVGVLGSAFGGESSIPHPIRFHEAEPTVRSGSEISTMLCSTDLALLAAPLSEEFAGYEVRPFTRFSVSPARIEGGVQLLNLGQIISLGKPTPHSFELPVGDLTKHGLICGQTGFGKTNTAFSILIELNRLGVPFLIVEPAKHEYRYLKREIKDLLVLTAGNELESPFRLNPFACPEGVLVQTHLDHLKAVFMAAFVYYSPMQYVLEECLQEIYTDKGWNFAANRNDRGQGSETFPTLTDLYRKIVRVTERTGYSQEIKNNVRAGLETRINNLRLGSKGLMLDTRETLPLDPIMNRPVLIELADLGTDDEKAFLMGLLFTHIYEYHESRKAHPQGLLHLTLVEEAHRLLPNISTETHEESSNIKGKAVKTIVDMLSEIRAYGEGILIAEQIPSRLAPDAYKNASLKVMHRLPPKEDRDPIGAAMGLDENRSAYAASLGVGEALVYGERRGETFLVKVGNVKEYCFKDQSAQDLSSLIGKDYDEIFPKSNRYLISCAPCRLYREPCRMAKSAARELATREDFLSSATKCLLTAIFNPPALGSTLDEIRVLAVAPVSFKLGIPASNLFSCAMAHAVSQWGQEKGTMHNMKYADETRLISEMADFAMSFVKSNGAVRQTEHDRALVLFRNSFESNVGPFMGCEQCGSKCLFQYEVAQITHNSTLTDAFSHLVHYVEPEARMVKGMCRLALDAAGWIVNEPTSQARRDISLCFLVQKLDAIRLRYSVRKDLIERLLKCLQEGI